MKKQWLPLSLMALAVVFCLLAVSYFSLATKYYQVAFNVGRGITPPPTQRVARNRYAVAPELGRVGDFYLEGWYSDLDLSAPFYFTTTRITSDIILHAKWIPFDYLVELDEGYSGGSVTSTTINVGEVRQFVVPSRVGYDFVGWTLNGVLVTDALGLLLEPWDYHESVRLVASWQGVACQIVYDHPVDVTYNPDQLVPYVTYGSHYKLHIPTKIGHQFTGWFYGDKRLTTADGSSLEVANWLTPIVVRPEFVKS